MNIQDLHGQALRYHCTPEQAKARIQEVIDLITTLRDEKSDRVRLQTFRKLEKYFTGYGRLEDLAFMSAVANPSAGLIAKQLQVKAHMEKHRRSFDAALRRCGRIIAKTTGISVALGYEIMLRRSKLKPYSKQWPIKDGRVVGPRGSIPLEGSGSAIHHLPVEHVKAKRKSAESGPSPT